LILKRDYIAIYQSAISTLKNGLPERQPQELVGINMKQPINLSTARMRIYCIWGCALLLYFILFEFAPLLRKGVISHSMAHGGFLKILSLVSPVLGAFSAYWFANTRNTTFTGTVSRERWLAAFWPTLAYHLILSSYLISIIYIHDYKGSENGVGLHDASFDDLVANAMQIGILLSAVATAPAAFLVGADRIEKSSDVLEKARKDGD
jgi:hypothetical protein